MNDMESYELAWGLGAGLLSMASLIHLFTGDGMYEVVLCQALAWMVFAVTKITLYIWAHPKKEKAG